MDGPMPGGNEKGKEQTTVRRNIPCFVWIVRSNSVHQETSTLRHWLLGATHDAR
jgi:hypothetical protein